MIFGFDDAVATIIVAFMTVIIAPIVTWRLSRATLHKTVGKANGRGPVHTQLNGLDHRTAVVESVAVDLVKEFKDLRRDFDYHTKEEQLITAAKIEDIFHRMTQQQLVMIYERLDQIVRESQQDREDKAEDQGQVDV